ncbi:cytochrome oxidase putative small subunit CydP [Thioflexithrix psekupsensis]|uniref:cytochrome oxidase putative small subunit CydP n=1 Tax=Thioflexithrix psekupsensis TaxID=1570016 RepID=UPI0015941A8C|nr:cytochrome oxidase putative small subunit CydP [Thioflexithrix psekupsensis]
MQKRFLSPLQREIIAILAIKLLILYILKQCFFSEPVAQHWTVPDMDTIFFSPSTHLE